MSLHQVKGLFFIIILKLTIELATCQECADQPPPFGMESGAIQNSQITSSSFASGYPPYSARLNNYYGAWCSSSLSTGEWLQIDLGNDKELLAIATEGFFSSYVTSYYLMYSFDKTKWYCFGYEGVAKKLSGSTVSTTHVLHNKPVVRYVRINPITWVGKICLKTELYGCPSPGRPVQSSMPETCNVLNENPTTFPPTTLAPVVGETTTLAEGATAGSTRSTTPVTTPEPTTELTTTIAPITWEPIDSIKIRVTSTSGVQVSTVYVGQTVLIGIFYHKGSDVMYNWNFGDGSTKQTDAGTFKYEYKAAGIYTLSVLGYNEVSNATNHFLITVQDQITGLKFIGKSNAMVPNTSFTFQWNIDKGTNVTYTIKYGDETPDTKISSVEVGPGPYSLVHKYVNTGHYRIQITAVNLISTAVPIHNKVIIEDKLKGLKVKWELPRRLKYNTKRLFIAVGEEITVKMSLEFGTDPLYKVDFGERKIDLGSRSYVNFQYSLNGTYSITAYTYNHVSALSQSYPIVINVQNDEMISGLKLSSSPTQFGFSTSIVLSVKSGTAFVCYWSFGDGLTALRDVTNFNDAMYHTYDSAGFYELNVCCENKHGNYCVQDTAAVLIPIISPSISAILKPMKSNSTQLFEITLMNGSDVTFDVMFGDGKSIRLHLPNTTARDQDLHINHTYEKPGVYYMMVHVYNKLGGIRTKLTDPIIVQNPLRANTLSLQNKNPVKIPDGRVIFTLELLEEVYHPTNVSCFWNFGDNRTTEIHSSVTEKIAHTFAEKGRYIVHVICKNRVSSKSISTNVIIYRMITPQIAIDSQTKIIDGSPQMMFLLSGENVTFCVTTQPYDRFYIWSGVDRTVSIETRLACIKRIINEARLYKIKVVVNNSLEIMTRMESFRVQKATHGLKISSNGSTIVRELAKLTWTAEIFGTDACFFINFNDSSDDMIYGPPSCSAKSIQLPLQGANREILIRHKYMQDGQYNVTIKAKNIVSSLTAQTYVTIIKPVCKILSIKISWNGKTNEEFTYLRSESFELYVEYKKQCYFGEGVDISWKLFKNSSGVETAVNLNSLQTRRKKYLSFGSLDLAYGYYRVVVTIKLTGSALQEIYGDVINFKSSFIHINPSPLQAKIKGGSFVMVDPDSSFTLDGGGSIDPDEYIPYLNLKYRWFCKRKLKHSDTFVGCYSSNKNYLEPIGFDRLLFTVSKELIRNTSYLFTLEVYKGSRTARAHQTVFVTFGLPPAMKIMCIPTCDGRLIPSKSLVLLGECTSCGSSDVSLGYKWELAEVINKTQKPRNTLPSETRYGLNTARFELLPNLLPPGKHFISTLSAWKRGGLPGYTTYTFVVYKNSPPKDGNCSVIPAQGNAMDTSFVVHCFDWLDQDPPLSYAFSYTLGEETTLLYSGEQNQRRFKLPIAEGADNSTINITSELTDSLGMSAVAWTTVLVSKPKKIDISNILNVIGGGAGGGIGGGGSGSSTGGSNGGSSSGGSGGSGAGSASKNQTVPKKSAAEVAQLANLVAYSLNNAGSGDDNDKKNEEDVNKAKQLRQTVASQMEDTISDMKNNNATKITDLDLVTSSLRALTKNPKELTMTALGDIANSLSAIGLTLKRLADLARKDSLTEAERLKIIQQIKNVAGKILETISNIMMGITALSESCNTLSPYEETVIKVKSMIAKVIDTLDEIAIILLSFMKVGDPKFVMKTDFANITLERNHGQSISDRNYSFTRGSIDLPKTDKLLPSYNMSSVDVIDLKIMEYNNVYQFCESPEDLISGLLHFNLLQANGSNHDITNTKEFIQINISHSPQALPASNFSERYYVDPLNGTTRFHRINWTSPETAVNIEFLPNSSYLIKWNMYVVYGEKVLSGEPPVLTVYSSNETDTLYVLQLSRNRYRETGLYKIYLKMDLSDEVEELWKADQVNISYSLGIYQSACFFWNNKKKAFISDGCKVGPKTSLKKTHCLCKHFGAFGSLVSIMKSELGFDPIIFTVPIKKLSPIAMIMVILVLCLYALLFAWAWYKDMKDKEKDDVVHLMDNHPKFKFKYEIKVFTGLSKNAGSTANVCCIIKGEDGQTSVRALHDIERQRFQRSAVDVFLLCTPLHLGRLNNLEIWHNNDGDDPSWYLIKVSIRDILKDELYYFMCNQWLAVEHHDGQVKRNLPVAKKEEVESFKHLFTSVARNRLTEGHLWLSVFTRPSRSRFSRVQRLSCCLMYIYCAMFINSFLYKVWGQADPSITMAIGPLRISPHQIYVTLICGLLLLPINEVMVGIFRSIKAKSDDDDDDNKLKDAPLLSNGKDLLELIDWYRIAGQSETKLHEVDSKEHLQSSGLCKKKMDEKTLAVLSALHDDGIVNSPMVTIGINEESGQALKRKNARKRIKLPYHFIFLAWFYFLALSSASAYFVAHFGEQYDEELAAQWLTSFVLIIFQDIVIINVFRVAFISLYYALVLKRPDESDYDNDRKDDNPQQTNNYEYDITKTKVTFPPSKEQLDEARTKKLREIQMDAIIKDMIIYVFFLTSLLVVSYSHRDPQAFAVAQNLIDSYIGGNYAGNGLSQNDGTSNYWTWLESTVLPSLSAANRSWVPFCEPSSNYSIDCNTRIIGTARLRQLRVPPGSCEIPPGMEIVSSTCNDFYSMLSEDKSNYLKGWIPTNKTRNKPDPWTYQSMFDIGGYPYFGILSTYSGGGYITELHSTGDGINDLKTNNWIDQRTRALFVEVSVYNAQVDMFGIATFLTEWMPTNGVLYFDNVKAARLFIPTDAAQTVTTVCQLFMVLFLMIFIYGESKKVLKERKQYFKDVWNWMEVFMIVFIFGCLGSLYQRSKSTTKAISEMQKNPDKFVSLIQAATFDELLTYFLGLVVFVANLKLLKLFKFNHRVFLFTRTLSTASDPLLSFMLVFFIFYIAFCSIYYLIFGTIMVEYKSMTSTIKSLFNILLGGFDFNSMEEADRVYGPLLFFSFMMIMVMILMNTFLTILMDAFADVQGDEHLKDGELDVLDHFLSRVEKFRGRKGNKIGQLPIESENDIEDIQSESQDSSIQEEKEGEYEGDQCEKKKNIDFYDDAKGFNNDDDGNDTDDDGDDSDQDDVLGQAIKRAKDRLRIKRIEMLKSAFKFTQTLATFKPIVKERKLEEKLDDITSFFCCTALDELVLDRAYEEMVRQYVKNLKRDYFNREIKRQNDFATSWQASKVDLKQPKNAIYKYTRHVEENQS